MKYFFTLIYLFLSFGLEAQINGTIQFTDDDNHRLQRVFQTSKYNNSIVISGRMSDANSEIPILLKLNTQGEVLWSTRTCLEKNLHQLQEVSFIISEDGFIYATANFSLKTTFSTNNILTSRFYKIDAATGNIIWISADVSDNRSRASNASSSYNHFIDLSSTKVVFGFNSYGDYNGYLLDKSTGEFLVTYDINTSISGLIADYNQNFIHYQGKSLYKHNQQDFDSILWHTDFSDIPSIEKVYEDKFGDLFLFSTSGIIKKIDPVLGHEIWSIRAGISSTASLIDLEETNDFLYLSYNYMGSSHYNISKVNKVTGELVWESFQIIDEINSNNPNPSGHSKANSIDLDCNGDLFLSGDYASDSLGKLAMGLMKISGDDGSKLQEAIIEISQNNNSDRGLFAGVFGDKVFFIGSESYYLYEEFKSKPVLVQTDIELNIIEQKDVPSGFKYGSSVKQIVPINNSNYLLTQKGAEVEIVKLNENSTTNWSTTLNHVDYTQADYLAIGDDYAYVSARGIVGETTELILYKIATVDGTLIDKVIVDSSSSFPAQTYELEVDSDIAFIYNSNFPYNTGSAVLIIHKWSGGEISDPRHQNVNEIFFDKKDENLVINYGENLFLIDNSQTHSINKNTLVVDSNYSSGSLYFYETRNTLQNDNILYRFGNSVYGGKQYIQKNNLSSIRSFWQQNYDSEGTIQKLIEGEDGYLYAIGKTDGISNLMKLSAQTGDQVWSINFTWPSNITNVKELGLTFDITENKVLRYFASEKDNGDVNLYLEIYDINGEVISQTINETILDGIEDYSLSVSTDGSFLIGGQYPQDCGLQSSGVFMHMVILEDDDDDNDNINNNLDQCPNTPFGETVDSVGCSQSQLDDDNDGINNNIDQCPNTPFGETVNSIGCSQNQLDDDNDGINNNIDQCPNTPLNTVVDIKGCILFPEKNLNIQTISETCPNKNNAKIIISANKTYDYTASLDGTYYNFTTDLIIDNLTSGNHELCITVSSEFYEQCYTIILAEGTTISGKLFSNKSGKVFINIEKGTAPYSVYVNGDVVSQTELSSFSVNASHGDIIEVETSKVCEGKLSERVDLTGEILMYPNPTKGDFEINLPITQKEVVIKLYTIQSQLISAHSYQIKNGKVNLSLKNQPKGVYFAKVLTKEPILFKILKK